MILTWQENYPYYDITNELKNIKPIKDFIIWLNGNWVKA
jgi:hypothetical protein